MKTIETKINRIICESLDGIVTVQVAGIDEKTMDNLTELKDDLIGKIVTIEATELSKDRENNYHLLHPRFIELRDDKDEADNFEKIKKIFEIDL
jgi:hypothetical protein